MTIEFDKAMIRQDLSSAKYSLLVFMLGNKKLEKNANLLEWTYIDWGTESLDLQLKFDEPGTIS